MGARRQRHDLSDTAAVSADASPLDHTPLDELAGEMLRWRRSGRGAVVARIAASEGLGGAARGELVAFGDAGERAGTLLAGLLDAQIAGVAEQLRAGAAPSPLLEATIDHVSAQRAGLACGGQASALVQRLDTIPEAFWSTLARREPAALVMIDGQATLSLPGDEPLPDGVGELTAALLERGAPAAVREAEGSILIQSFHPGRRMVVVGEAALAHALTRQAGVLGWGARLVHDLAGAERAVTDLRVGDAVVVLTHDPEIDAPVLADALRRGIGYVGAMGSRRTQARRAEALAGLGLGPAEIARIHGPVGLDLAPATAAEAALAVCAEVLAAASGRPPVSLRDRPGPINA
jgi:xanthine dehydrogenase accessory factor